MLRYLLFLTMILCCLFSPKAKASTDSVIYFNGKDVKNIGKYLSLYEENGESVSFNDVLAHPNLFSKCETEVPNLGIVKKPHWIKFEIVNNSDEDRLIVDLSQPNIAEVKFYSIINSQIDSVGYNLKQGYSDRKYSHQFYLFDLHLKKGEKAVCYMKLQSETQVIVPLSIHTPTGLFDFLQKEDVLSAIYIGLMLSLVLYNAFLYVATGEKHYLSYVNYIFWVFVAQMAVLGLFERVFPIRSEWLSSRLLTFSGAMSGIGAILFVKSFLHTSVEAKGFNKLLNVFLFGYFFAILLLLIGYIIPAYRIVNLVAGGGAAIVLIFAFELSRRKYSQTKFFLFAWCIFLISVLVFVLKDYGVLPTNVFTARSVQIGSVIEALLLSFALADKINTYRKEMLELQVRELAISQENEKLIREQNVILEQKVRERTEELQESNKSLSLTLSNLKDAQAQLVESEKMASLGQLTAGVAHEINNPINFVTSNVSPLRRDVGILWDIIDQIEMIALDNDLQLEEKQEKIQNIKNINDVDYLKSEINFLLKGIQEGAERTAEIVRSLRIFSRIDEDTLKRADLNECLDSTLVILNPMTKERIRVIKNYHSIPMVECYAGKLNQVFMNILSNAIYAVEKKYNGNAGGEIKIETKLDEDLSKVIISIMDNGTGIPPEVIGRIFEPFFTTKDVGEGTGLGMSIAYKTIERHNGRIGLQSTVGEGTTFDIHLPIKQ